MNALDLVPDDDGPHDDISRLEARIEALADAIERCRKIAFGAKLAISLGAMWIVLMVLGGIRFDPMTLVAAIAAVIGGTVLFGSNSSTWQQTAAALQKAESQRADLIGRIDLRVVGGRDYEN